MSNHIKGWLHDHKKLFFYCIGILCVGFFMGIFISKSINEQDIKHLQTFLHTIDAKNHPTAYFQSQAIMGISYIILLFLFSTSVLGICFISMALFMKGIQFSFSCSLFIHAYQMKGILGIIITLLPQCALDLFITLLMSAYSIQQSYFILYASKHNQCLDYKYSINKMVNMIFICIILVLLDAYMKSTVGISCIQFFNGL